MLIPLQSPRTSNKWYLVLDDALSDSEINKIQSLSEYFTESKITEHSSSMTRTSLNTFVPADDKFESLYTHLRSAITKVNEKYFRYNLTDFEPFQYARYRTGDQYVMHTDSGVYGENGFVRKLSFSILLNDEFTGGDLQIYSYNFPESIKLKKGSIVFFPSFMPHSVTPVTSGYRDSLVGWISGPNFI